MSKCKPNPLKQTSTVCHNSRERWQLTSITSDRLQSQCTTTLLSQNTDGYKREALRTYADVGARVVLSLYRRLTIQTTMVPHMVMATRTATAIPACASAVSPPSLSASPETQDRSHLLVVLAVHMVVEQVGATTEYAARCCTIEFVNDVTSTSSMDAVTLHVAPSVSAYVNEREKA